MTPEVDRFIRERSEESFRALYRAHTPGAYLLALRLVGGSRTDAEDAVQEAWIRAVQRITTVRGASAFRTWLCGIVVNCCREIVARRKPSGEAPERSWEGSGTRLDLERAIAALPPRAREVVVLHDIEGHTHEEIAALLGIDAGTSRSHLHDARAALRRRLQKVTP